GWIRVQRASLSPAVVENALTRAPLPIADAVATLVASSNAHEERDRVVECFRAILRYVGVLALAAALQRGRKDSSAQVTELLRSLRRRGLTDGDWFAIARELLRGWAGQGGGHPLPQLVALVGNASFINVVEQLLAMRKNETVAHGTTGDAREIEEVLARRIPQLEALIELVMEACADVVLVQPLASPETEA